MMPIQALLINARKQSHMYSMSLSRAEHKAPTVGVVASISNVEVSRRQMHSFRAHMQTVSASSTRKGYATHHLAVEKVQYGWQVYPATARKTVFVLAPRAAPTVTWIGVLATG